MSEKEILDLFNQHRMKLLSKFIDRKFINNEDFLENMRKLMDGSMRHQIFQALDQEYQILRDDANDENIIKLVEAKVSEIIEKLYP